MSNILSSKIYPRNTNGSIKVIGQQRQPQSSLLLVHYLYTGVAQTISPDLSIAGTNSATPAVSNWTSQYPDSLGFNTASLPMVTFTSTGTRLNFPVSGQYNISFRVRPTITGTSALGQTITPYISKNVYLGTSYSGITVANRLCQQENFTGPIQTNQQSSSGDTSIDFTGLFMAGDSVFLNVFATTTSGITTQVAANTGTRFSCSLIQPMKFDTALNLSKMFYSSISLNLPAAASGRVFKSIQFFVGTVDVTALAIATTVGITGASSTNSFSGNPSLTVGNNIAASLTATFVIPQAITSIVYIPVNASLCTSWGVNLTLTDAYGIQKISTPAIGTGLGTCTQYSATASGTNNQCTFNVGVTNGGSWTYT